MKNTKICPKCNSMDIAISDGYIGPYGSGKNVIIGATIFSSVKVNRYICLNCGYTEEWINKEDLIKSEIQKRYIDRITIAFIIKNSGLKF